MVQRRNIWPNRWDHEKSYLIDDDSVILELFIVRAFLPSFRPRNLESSLSMSKPSRLWKLLASMKMSFTLSASFKDIYLQDRRVLFQATCWTGAMGMVAFTLLTKPPYRASIEVSFVISSLHCWDWQSKRQENEFLKYRLWKFSHRHRYRSWRDWYRLQWCPIGRKGNSASFVIHNNWCYDGFGWAVD